MGKLVDEEELAGMLSLFALFRTRPDRPALFAEAQAHKAFNLTTILKSFFERLLYVVNV